MLYRVLNVLLKTIATAVFLLLFISSVAYVVRWLSRPAPYSAEALLSQADELGWNNDWGGAFPLFVRAQALFERKRDLEHALYAKVSQIPVMMESRDLVPLIAELNKDLDLPAAKNPSIRLRILEMKARCEEEYDASLSIQTFAQVEELALKQYKPYLASRASGERGILAFTLGDFQDASTRVQRAYAVAKFLGDPAAHIRFAGMIGLGLQHMGRPKQALVFLNEAIDGQKNHPAVALPYVAISAKVDCLSDLGRPYEALELADQNISRLKNKRYFGQLQSILTSRSDVLMRSGDQDSAIAGYDEALGYARRLSSWRAINNIDGNLASAYEKKHDLSSALASIDDAINANTQTPREMFLVPGNLALKAKILAEMGKRADAERVYARATDVMDVLLSHVPTPEVERLLLAQLGSLYSGYFRLVSDQGRLAEAFEIIERAHGRVEAQRLKFDRISVPQERDPDEVRLQQLELALLKGEGRNGSRATLLQVPVSSRFNSAEQSLHPTASLRNLQDRLSGSELLVEYVLGEPSSYALAITRERISRYTLPGKRKIEGEVEEYRKSIQKQVDKPDLAKTIFKDVLGFTRNFENSDSLIIVADEGLHLLPFSALLDESGRYVLEAKTISLVPSGTVLHLLRSRKSEAERNRPYLGVAPWTDRANTEQWVLKSRGAGPSSVRLPALPESKDEVESIAAMMPQPSTVLIGSQATKEKFQSLPLREYRILHLALHGVVDSVFPDRSALVFAPSSFNDGRLEARDIRRLRLNAELVTLSACDTGVGPISAAGIESLHTAFIEAGADAVISTLWELQDTYTDRFMKSFYMHLLKEHKAAALRAAKLDLLRSHVAPYYWATFELVGNPTGTPLSSADHV
ncbi:MAG: CHAT domain-containing protein [Bryobacteraceae bacterium]|jgi:CHAT domain-containing protein